MPRNISFALTTRQFRNRTKRVTRRLGWLDTKVGDELMGCVKCMGLKPGEKLQRLGLIRVVDVRLERLDRMSTDPVYGKVEAALEGFPEMTGIEFVQMFCKHMRVPPEYVINRIEYKYAVPLVCICGAWDDPASYGNVAEWDRSEDWCPVHGIGSKGTV